MSNDAREVLKAHAEKPDKKFFAIETGIEGRNLEIAYEELKKQKYVVQVNGQHINTGSKEGLRSLADYRQWE